MKFRSWVALIAILLLSARITAAGTSPASAYVQGGLVAQWDGIENAGTGQHSDSLSVWKNLKGGADWTLTGVGSGLTVTDTSLAFNGSGSGYGEIAAEAAAGIFPVSTTDAMTIEVVARIIAQPEKGGNDRQCLLHSQMAAEKMLAVLVPSNRLVVATSMSNIGGPFLSPVSCAGEFRVFSVTYSGLRAASARTDGVAATVDPGVPMFSQFYSVSDGPARLGKRLDNSSPHPLKGEIFAVRVYNRALTVDESLFNLQLDQQRFNGGSGGEIAPPEGYRYDANHQLQFRLAVAAVEGGTIYVNGTEVTDGEAWIDVDDETITLRAVADGDLSFAGWRTTAGTLADPSAAETTLTGVTGPGATVRCAFGEEAIGGGVPVTVAVKDWTGKLLATVKGVSFDGTFTLDASAYFSADVDYVSAFDGGEVVKTPTNASHASESVVRWRNLRRPLVTEIFVQPYMPYSVSFAGADPFIVKDPASDRWLFTATGAADIKLLSTLNFPLFANGNVVHTPNDSGFCSDLWAPEIHFLDGGWYLYYSAGSDVMRRHYVVRATTTDTSKLGLAKNWGTRTELPTPDDKWSIDGTVFTAGGHHYFVWSGWPGNGNGCQNLYLAELETPTSFAASTRRVLISTPEKSWETVSRSPCTVNEGPVALQHGNTVTIVYSCNGSWSADYALAYLTCTNGNYTDAASWTKHDGTVFSKRYSVNGPGHCAFTKDADGNDFIVYHANDGSHVGWNERYVRCQPFAWHGDEPVFGAPRPTGAEPYEGFDVNRDYRRSGAETRTLVVPPAGEKVVCAPGETAVPAFIDNDFFTVSGELPLAAGRTVTLTLALKDRTKTVWADGTTANRTCVFTTDGEAEEPSVNYGPVDTSAVTYTWTGGTGDWSNPAKWEASAAIAYGIPSNAVHATAVVPGAGVNAAAVRVKGAYGVKMLELANGGDTLALEGGAITVSGAKNKKSYIGGWLADGAAGNAEIVFSGAAPALVFTETSVRNVFGCASAASGTVTLRYTVPAAGWATAPLRADGSDSKIVLCGNVRFDVDVSALGVPASETTVPLSWGKAKDDDGVTPDGINFHGTTFAEVKARSTVVCAAGATAEIICDVASVYVRVVAGASAAEIGGTAYATIAEACAAAQPGDTITLGRAPTAADKLVFKAGVTIDFKGQVETLAAGTYEKPEWFDIVYGEGTAAIALNTLAKPTVGDGVADEPFTVDADTVEVVVGNVKPGLYYALVYSATLEGLAAAMPTSWYEADGEGELAPLTLPKGGGAAGFYRVVAADVLP